MVSKVFDKLVNNGLVDNLEKDGLFSHFHYGFSSSQSTIDLLTAASDGIARAFKGTVAIRDALLTAAVVADINKVFNMVWHAGLLHKLKSYGSSGQIFGLISSFLINRRLRVVLDGMSSDEYPFNAMIFLTFLIMLCVMLLSMLMLVLSTPGVIRHLICFNKLILLLNLNLVHESLGV